MKSTPIFLPGKSHGQRNLVGYSPWGLKVPDMTAQLHFHFSLWQTGHSAVTAARSALVSGSLCCWTQAKPPSLPPGPLGSWVHRMMARRAGERLTGTHRTCHLILLIIKTLLVSINMGYKYLNFFFYPITEVYLYTTSQDFFVSNFSVIFLLSPYLSI